MRPSRGIVGMSHSMDTHQFSFVCIALIDTSITWTVQNATNHILSALYDHLQPLPQRRVDLLHCRILRTRTRS